jgi:hypothetical protein
MKPKGKTRGSSTARTPPVPTESHAEIDDWMIQSVMPRLHPIVQRLDELIRETIPGLRVPTPVEAFVGLGLGAVLPASAAAATAIE